jgi:hypothetical protein
LERGRREEGVEIYGYLGRGSIAMNQYLGRDMECILGEMEQ